MRRRVIRWSALLFAVLALLASACGGDQMGGGDVGAPVRDIQAEAQETAESIVLELSDFPNGWRASAPSRPRTAPPSSAQCLRAGLLRLHDHR